MDSCQCFFNGCKAVPGPAFCGEPVHLVDQNIDPVSNMHAIKKTLSKSKLPLKFVSLKKSQNWNFNMPLSKSKHCYELFFSVCMFILGSSLKRLRN